MSRNLCYEFEKCSCFSEKQKQYFSIDEKNMLKNWVYYYYYYYFLLY